MHKINSKFVQYSIPFVTIITNIRALTIDLAHVLLIEKKPIVVVSTLNKSPSLFLRWIQLKEKKYRQAHCVAIVQGKILRWHIIIYNVS